MSKRKGTNAERELVHLLWAGGWAAVRVAGSGSSSFPSPDILAGNKVRKLAIEVKFTSQTRKYFALEEIQQLTNFAVYFGAEPWLAIKFPKKPWAFFNPEDLPLSGECFVATDTSVSLSFEELCGEFI